MYISPSVEMCNNEPFIRFYVVQSIQSATILINACDSELSEIFIIWNCMRCSVCFTSRRGFNSCCYATVRRGARRGQRLRPRRGHCQPASVVVRASKDHHRERPHQRRHQAGHLHSHRHQPAARCPTVPDAVLFLSGTVRLLARDGSPHGSRSEC